MAKSKNEMAEAVLEVANALRSQKSENRRQIATKIMDLANLSFGGLVLSQAFFENFNRQIAILGVLLFAIAYYGAFMFMEGGVGE